MTQRHAEANNIQKTNYTNMKQAFTIIAFLISLVLFAQKVQPYAPWATESMSKNNNTPSLEDVSAAAKNYFKTIDQNKKRKWIKTF